LPSLATVWQWTAPVMSASEWGLVEGLEWALVWGLEVDRQIPEDVGTVE
jgi:hypothetical protein